MKTTNNNKVLFTTIGISILALLVLTEFAANLVPVLVIAGSYVVVAILFALAAMDYRLGFKDYSVR